MKAIIILMLLIEAAGLVMAAIVMVARRPQATRARPVWSGLAVALTVIAASSFNIASSHPGSPGAELLQMTAPILLGMGLAMALMAIRERRALDRP